MSDLVEITKHMRARDLLPLWSRFGDLDEWESVHLALADDVPGLVAHVQRLYAENARLVSRVAAAKNALDPDLHHAPECATRVQDEWWSTQRQDGGCA